MGGDLPMNVICLNDTDFRLLGRRYWVVKDGGWRMGVVTGHDQVFKDTLITIR